MRTNALQGISGGCWGNKQNYVRCMDNSVRSYFYTRKEFKS